MSTLPRLVRQALTVARRDFIATVVTPTFLLFLLAPLIMVSIGTIGGLGAAGVAGGAKETRRIVAIAGPAVKPAIVEADRRLRRVAMDGPPPLVVVDPARDPAAQAHAILHGDKETATTAVLHGPPERPTIIFAPGSRRHADYLALVADDAVDLSTDNFQPLAEPRADHAPMPGASPATRSQLGFFAVFGIFFLTLLLAGQAIGTMAEERSSKVIEILAASAPLEAVFLGKLLGMFGVAVLFVGFWGSVLGLGVAAAPADLSSTLSGATPAIGWPMFAALFLIYFTLSYLLLGATFLGIGAQAATPREVQMLSLPITIVQVGMFALASAAASKPGSNLARIAEIFPLSSPLAMAARAGSRAELWPHLLAIPWAAIWVALVITVGARAFRRGVLQSGTAMPRWLARLVRRGA